MLDRDRGDVEYDHVPEAPFEQRPGQGLRAAADVDHAVGGVTPAASSIRGDISGASWNQPHVVSP
jgi:hypothetical protein